MIISIWRCPKIGVPPNHHKSSKSLDHFRVYFSIETETYGFGDPPFSETPI
jgi:hypothetical protein